MKDILTCISTFDNFKTFSRHFKENVGLIYRINNNILEKAQLNFYHKNAYLGVFEENLSETKNFNEIARNIIFECLRHNYKGIFLEIYTSKASELAFKLDKLCEKQKIPLFVPFSYAKSVSYANLVFDMTISAGNMKNILEYAILEHGKDRISAQISYNIFRFEIPSDEKRPLTLDILPDLTGQNIFFSENLMLNYYTTMISKEKCHFTAFDDMNTLQKKIELLTSLNINKIFISEKNVKNFKILY